jgi:hypothetical protein
MYAFTPKPLGLRFAAELPCVAAPLPVDEVEEDEEAVEAEALVVGLLLLVASSPPYIFSISFSSISVTLQRDREYTQMKKRV